MGISRPMALLLVLALILALAAPAGAVDSRTSSDGLAGRRFLVLGDSYTAGYGLPDPSRDWVGQMAETYGMTRLDFSVSGSPFAVGGGGAEPMAERVWRLPEDGDLDFILLQGGANDCSKSIPLGGLEERNPNTCCGALNLILDTLEDKYPGVPIVGFTPWITNGWRNNQGLLRQEYTDAILEVFRLRGYPCFNASDTALSGIHMDQEAFRRQYCLSSGDYHHLNPAGHARFAPVFAAWLGRTLYNWTPADRFYDLAAGPDSERQAASVLLEEGVFLGGGGRLFYSSRSITRGTLALTLFRMSGAEAGNGRDLADVEPGTELYGAVCWAMDREIFSPADSFLPEQILTREMLSAVLYRYYTWSGGEVLTLPGLGSFPDGGDVAGYARVPMSWALHAGILTDLEGRAAPGGAVSRGQLALALYALRQL